MECSLCGNDSHEIPHCAFAKKQKKKTLLMKLQSTEPGLWNQPKLEQDPCCITEESNDLEKVLQPLGLLSHLINGETSAHSAFLLPTAQLCRDIAEIRDGKAHQEPECTLHTDKAGRGSGPRACSWLTAGLELRTRRQNSQA